MNISYRLVRRVVGLGCGVLLATVGGKASYDYFSSHGTKRSLKEKLENLRHDRKPEEVDEGNGFDDIFDDDDDDFDDIFDDEDDFREVPNPEEESEEEADDEESPKPAPKKDNRKRK